MRERREKLRSTSPATGFPGWKGYAVAALCVLVAFAIRYCLSSILGPELPFMLFIAASLFAAWYGGALTGILALSLGLFLSDSFFVPRVGEHNPVETLRIIRYVLTTLLGVVLIEVLHRNWRRAETAVQQMTFAAEQQQRTEAHLREAERRYAQLVGELQKQVSRRTEDLSSTVDSLRSVLYQIAHRLRAPLRSIQGYLTFLRADYEPMFDSTALGYFDRVSQASGHMDLLIGDLLRYGELGHIPVRAGAVNLRAAVARVLSILRPQIESRSADVIVLNPLPDVCGDPKIVQEILLEVLENSLKFVSRERRPKIRIWAEPQARAMRLWVKDNGIGIAARFQTRIFEPFEALEPTSDKTSTGIGLAIVKHGMLRMGGKVGLESEPGAGTRVWLEFRTLDREEELIDLSDGTNEAACIYPQPAPSDGRS